MSAARIIKLPDEIELMRQSCAVAESALHDMEQAIRPGISENELLAVFWHRVLALGGEHCFARLIVSGYKTNPWFHEADGKQVQAGELVAIDTDMIGPECYVCDISRTFLCGETASAEQKEAYNVAYDFVQGCMELIKPGLAFSDFVARCPPLPQAYREQAYGVIVHGIGTDDESPNVPCRAILTPKCLKASSRRTWSWPSSATLERSARRMASSSKTKSGCPPMDRLYFPSTRTTRNCSGSR